MNSSTEKNKFSFKNLFHKKDKGSSVAQADPSIAMKKKPKKKKIITIAIIVVVIVALIVVAKLMFSSKSSVSSSTTYSTTTAAKMDISETLSSSGTLEPADSYSVTSLVTGEILTSDFEEGDMVTKGQILYTIDTTDTETSIESAKLSVERAQLSYNEAKENLENLSVTAPVSGTITEINVKVGDTVNSGGTIGTIKNSATMSLTVPFNSTDVDSFYVGETATVTLDSTFETLTGTISKISNAEKVETGNMLVKEVTIDVKNPGGITDSTTASAKIGNIACNDSATFAYKSSQTVTAKTSGTVASIIYDEGDNVTKGTTIVKLESDTLSQSLTSASLSLQDAENSLADKEDALDDYTITAPIDGTVITKTYKAGDKLGSSSSSSSSSTSLCTIYDLSYLTMDMNIDELDVSQVEVGQEVTITADAVEGATFTGVVTKVNIKGTTTNGVTAYPVTVKITDTDGLLPGMNVDAEIVVKSVSDVIGIPVDAVVRGNKVLVQTDSSKTQTNDDGTLVVGTDGIPGGFEYVDVTLGINNDDYIEVDSGISEGDVVAKATTISDNSNMQTVTMSGGEGDMGEGGGAPAGGGGGGGGPMGG